MTTITVISVLLVLGAIYAILRSLPVGNTISGNVLTVKTVIGSSTIELEDGFRIVPVPDDAKEKLIRVFGTSVGKKRSGKFRSLKTKRLFYFYTCGKGELSCIESGDNLIIVDGIG